MRILWGIALAACGGAGAPAPPSSAAQPAAPPAVPDPLVDADLRAPSPEVVRDASHALAIPPLPAFDLPAPYPDGSHSVRELRVARAQLLGQDLTVKGVVTWVYDCVADVRQPKESVKAARKRIEDDPTLCERAKFYVGDAASSPREKSLWIVDVPRFYNKLELARIAKPERTQPDRCEPGDKATCIPYKVGDQVLVTGTFALRSPHAETTSDGLLVYKRMKNVTQKRETAGGVAIAPTPPLRLPGPLSVAPASTSPRPIPKVRQSARVASLEATDAASRAYAQRQLDTAIDSYKRATATWRDNHRAWYGLAAAYSAHDDWTNAADAAGTAVDLAPDTAMYHLIYARTLYRAGKLEPAQAHAAAALALEPSLWRAHMYLGLAHRDAGRAKQAAESLARSLQLGADDPQPWIALAELFRAWDYTDEAIRLVELATTVVSELRDVWFALGVAYDDKGTVDKALDAYTHAIAAGNTRARYARGQLYFRKKDRAAAQADLEQFVQAPDADAFYKQQAEHMLRALASRP